MDGHLNSFSARKPNADDLDMTAMVDVTFLLVIFFMITASFTLESVFKTPQQNENATGSLIEPIHRIEIHIDEFDHFSVVVEGIEVATANNKYELKVELQSVLTPEYSHATILTSPDAKHEKVVDALDVLVGLRLAVSVKMTS